MLPDYPLRLPGLPAMTFVRELEEFDGPVLSEWKGSFDRRATIYLDKWGTRADGIVLSIIVRSAQRSVAEYLSGRISMRTLLLGPSDGIGFVVDRRGGEVVSVYLVALESSLPAGYLPKEGTRHDENLRPAWRTVPQSFLIAADWDASVIADVETLYHDVSGFLFLTEPAANRSLPGGVLHYRYDRGFPIGAAFRQIRATIPREHRARSVGVAAGSPGVLTLEASPAMASRLAGVLSGLPRFRSAYDAVSSWSGISPGRLERMPDLDAARQQVATLCSHLKVDVSVLLPPGSEKDPYAVLVAGKLVAAFHRKLWQTVRSEAGQFISVNVGTPSKQLEEDGEEEPEDEDE